MSTWVLILYFATMSANGGMTLTTADFSSRSACETAATKAKAMGGAFTFAKHVCVEKGDGPATPSAPVPRP